MNKLIPLRCKTTNGVVEKRFKDDAEVVDVSRRFACRSALTHRLQINHMGLSEVPSELFRMKNLKQLWLEQQPLLAAERNCAPDNARAALCAIVGAIGP